MHYYIAVEEEAWKMEALEDMCGILEPSEFRGLIYCQTDAKVAGFAKICGDFLAPSRD